MPENVSFWKKYWWIVLGALSAVTLSGAFQYTNTDGWIVITSNNTTANFNWNVTRPNICTVGNYSYWNGSTFLCSPDTTGNGSGGVTMSQVVSGVGNWSLDKPSYMLLTGSNSNVSKFYFDNTTQNSFGERYMGWDNAESSLSIGYPYGATLQVGKEIYYEAFNLDNQTIQEGMPVSIVGASGNRLGVALTNISSENSSHNFIGLATTAMVPNAKGFVTSIGEVHKLDTSNFTEGQAIFVSGVKGQLTQTPPSAPLHIIQVGVVTVKHAVNGIISVSYHVMPKLEDLSDVDGIPLNASGQVLVWNNTASLWDASANLNDYLLASDQRYNDTAAILSVGNWSADKSSYSTTATSNAAYAPRTTTYTNITALQNGLVSVGNWSLDKGSYTASSLLVGALGNWSLDKSSYTTSANLVTALGNWSLDKTSYSTTTVGDSRWGNQSFNATCAAGTYPQSLGFNRDGTQNATNCVSASGFDPTGLYNNVTSLQNSNTTTNGRIDTLNTTINNQYTNITTLQNNPFKVFNYTRANIASTSATAYSGVLNLSLAASSTYIIECEWMLYSAAITTGNQLQINSSQTLTTPVFTYNSLNNGSAGVVESYATQATGTSWNYSDLGSTLIANEHLGYINGYVVTPATPPQLSFFQKTEVGASSSNVDLGSFCEAIKIA